MTLSSKSSTVFLMSGCALFVIGIPLCLYLFITNGLGTAALYGVILFIGMLAFLGIGGMIDANKKVKQRNILLSLKPNDSNFHDSLSYVSDDVRTKMTLDSVNEQLFIWTPENDHVKTIADVKPNMPYKIYRYSFENILAVEHIVDDHIVGKLTRKSESAKFWLKNMPAVINLPTQDANPSKKPEKISLKLLIQDQAKPIYWIHFYANSSQPLDKHTDEYKQIQTDLQQWLTAFHFIIKEADKKDGYIASEDNETPIFDVHSNTPKTEKAFIIQTKLIPLLLRVAQHKAEINSSIHNDYKAHPPTSSYFDDLLNKNREMMTGRKKDN